MTDALELIFAAVEEVNANQKAQLVAKNEKYFNSFMEKNREEAYKAYFETSSGKKKENVYLEFK